MPTTLLLDKEEMTRILERLACEVLERHGQCERVMLVGIERRGADLARRLGALMQQKLQRPLPLGTLDINLYRDDWTSLEGKPHIGQSRITAPVDNAEIILIDDVLFSGRTIRAALEALLDYGRPRKVELLVLVDRGHRELPIQADYIGRSVDTRPQEQVDVLLEERDGRDEVPADRQELTCRGIRRMPLFSCPPRSRSGRLSPFFLKALDPPLFFS